MKRGKKAQFYLIAAAIISLLIITLTTVYNSVNTIEEPKKIYSLSKVLEKEAFSVIDYSLYNKEDTNQNIKKFLEIFGRYLNENTNENLVLIFIYGNITEDKLICEIYGRGSQGEINMNLGENNFALNITHQIMKLKDYTINVNHTSSGDFININLEGVEYNNIPVLEDNNFLFILSSSADLNTYITSNIYGNEKKQQGFK